MRLVCISDTHSMHRQIPRIPDGDVLIHAGDCLGRGTLDNVEDLNDWLGMLPHQNKIVIAGNHDWVFQETPALAREALSNAFYLEDSGISLQGVNFWGSPWTPVFMDWAFMLEGGQALFDKWKLIPDNTHVLITHGPPKGFGDEVDTGLRFQNVGCIHLLDRVDEVSPKAHIFGHIHEGYGEYLRGSTLLINASTCTERYEPTNAPIVLDI
ncbi:Predicted phosphoesterase [Marinobacter sp. es.048]|uniref:metallophosphatase domain-containing protein n=1 Tax=Marinobacter sp. es.048 TaxID=1761795 RepID=UPI000B590709|nr:metallophosphatase domain-containing protein [Marinobacter sp. es.048]SNC59297.1 Predicted phosphoesterase [Marinobacter sp. es.048]